MKVNLTKWDIQDYLKTAEDRAHYLEAAMETAQKDGDVHFLAVALADVARAIGDGAVSVFLTGVSTGIGATPIMQPRTIHKTAKREPAMA